MFKGIGKIFLLLFIALVLAAVIAGSLNYTGVCIAEKRILSDEEKIHIAIDDLNKHGRGILSSIPECKSDAPKCEYIPYKNTAEFLSQNSDCCSVSVWKTHVTLSTSFSQRISGYYLATVRVIFDAHYKNKEGQDKTQQIKRAVLMGNCGDVHFVTGEIL